MQKLKKFNIFKFNWLTRSGKLANLDKKKEFLKSKINEMAEVWKNPVFDHKHKAIDVMNRMRSSTSNFISFISKKSEYVLKKYLSFKYFSIYKAFKEKRFNLFNIDLNDDVFLFKFEKENFRLSTIAFDYVFNKDTKSYYLFLDFGLKHVLCLPLSNFFNLSNKLNLDRNYFYLFLNSFCNNLKFSNVDVEFDYFSNLSLNKYRDKILPCFFYNRFFFRKLELNFMNLDFFVSTQFSSEDYFNGLVLSNKLMPLSFVFAKSYWVSNYLVSKNVDLFFFKKFLSKNCDYLKSDLFLCFDNSNESGFFFENVIEFFFNRILDKISLIFSLNFFINFIKSYNNLGLFFENKYNVKKVSKSKFLNLFYNNYYCLFVFLLFLLNFYFLKFNNEVSCFVLYQNKLSFVFNGRICIENFKYFMRNKKLLESWQSNLFIRKKYFVMGFGGFFFFPLLTNEWYFMNNYHKRVVSKVINKFLNCLNLNDLFFFFLKKEKYFFFFSGFGNINFFNVIYNIRLFFNYFCFVRYMSGFDNFINENCENSVFYKLFRSFSNFGLPIDRKKKRRIFST